MSLAMSKAEREAFLGAVRVAVLAIPDSGRGPLSAPVWYRYDGGRLVFLTQSTSRKGRLLGVGTRVSLTVQTETAPYAYVSVEGPVSAIEPYSLEYDLLPMAVRYLGEADGRAYVDGTREGWDAATSIKVSVEPRRWLSVDYGKRG